MNPDYSKKLKEFEEHLKKIPEIIAVKYTGSTATQKWDKYSDIDIDIIVKDKDYNKIVKKLLRLLSWWGKVKFHNHYRDYVEEYVYIGKDYLKVEIDPIKQSDLKPSLELKNIRIGFDKTGDLIKVYKKSQKIKKKISHKAIINELLQERDNQLYIARHFMRGQKFSAYSEVDTIRWDLFRILSKIKEMNDYDLIRSAEKNLTEKEKQMWERSKLKKETKEDLKRALRENWDFMKYVEKLYEKKTKKKLNLKCNDKEILKKVNDIFEGR